MTEVGVILDVRWRSEVRTAYGSLLEYGVQAAAALAAALLDQGNRVGLLLYGNTLDWTFPGYGKIQRERILRALARAALGDAPVFEDLDRFPTRLFPARAQLVLISPLLLGDRDMLIRLRARGYELLVISPDPITFERAALGIGTIRRAGRQGRSDATQCAAPRPSAGGRDPGRLERRRAVQPGRRRDAQSHAGPAGVSRRHTMRRPATMSIALATLLLVLAYALGARWIGASASVALGCLWLVGLRRGWNGTDSLGLVGLTGMAAIGVWLALVLPILLASQVAALAAWDLDRFAQRLRRAGHTSAEALLMRAHLQRLVAGW